MKIQLNTVEDVERFVDGNPLLVDAIKQEVVRGFDKPYIKPLDNSQEARQIRRELRETLRKEGLFTNDLVKEGLCHAIESDVKALLENEAFVKETVKQCFYSAFDLNESHLRAMISRLLEKSLKDI